ncbi:MAG TPA: electron transfer flavoprotein subunit beta/FixA family protein [Thermoanaerobaculia bacterium]|nr:electron transfer flavoprotein subunit beta/FixA family protein [Thermoanaerobaculia bacterium]
MKQILDPEVPARDFRIDPVQKEAEPGSASLVTNIFCENALETALQLKERTGGATITALSFGPESAEETLRKALAMKADSAALVLDDGRLARHPLNVARVLAAAIRRLGTFELILTGREAGDWGAGQTGALLAEELGIPYVAFADALETSGAQLRIRRQTEAGFERIEARLPLVVTITNDEHNVPRIPKVRDVMMAHRQTLTRFELAELHVAGDDYYEVVDLAVPKKETRCEFVDVEELARRIAEITAAL